MITAAAGERPILRSGRRVPPGPGLRPGLGPPGSPGTSWVSGVSGAAAEASWVSGAAAVPRGRVFL